MVELFKKLGVPAGISALVGAIIAMIPFIFKIDERYAKAEELEKQIKVVSAQIQDLSVEVGQLAGSQQVLVAVISAPITNRIELAKIQQSPPPVAPAFIPTTPTDTTTNQEQVFLTPKVPGSAVEAKEQLEAVSRTLARTQYQVQQIRENPGVKQ